MKKELNNKFSGDEELEKLSPMLSQLNKDNPFGVPSGYFDSLNSEIMKKIESLPDLDSVPVENPFAVPAGYFESLPSGIMDKVHSRKTRRISIAEWLSHPVPRYSLVAASVALILIFSFKFFNRTITIEYASQQNESSQFDAACLAQLDESVLAEIYAEESSALEVSHDEELENYLLDNDIDLNSITEQL